MKIPTNTLIKHLLEYIDDSLDLCIERDEYTKKISKMGYTVSRNENLKKVIRALENACKRNKKKIASKLSKVLIKDSKLIRKLAETIEAQKIQLCSQMLCEKLTKAYIAYKAFCYYTQTNDVNVFKIFKHYAYKSCMKV